MHSSIVAIKDLFTTPSLSVGPNKIKILIAINVLCISFIIGAYSYLSYQKLSLTTNFSESNRHHSTFTYSQPQSHSTDNTPTALAIIEQHSHQAQPKSLFSFKRNKPPARLSIDDLSWRFEFFQALDQRISHLRLSTLSEPEKEQLFFIVTEYLNQQIALSALNGNTLNIDQQATKKALLSHLETVIDQELELNYRSNS